MRLTRRNFLKKTGKLSKWLISCSLIPALTGCYDDLFKYSIHEVEGDYSGKNINIENAARIENLYKTPGTDFTFALVADSHTYYDELESAVEIISSREDVNFVVHLGDFTDTGLLFQYEQTISVLEELPVPYVVVIGNHDILGNGLDIFRDIFGTTDFHFKCNGTLFIIGNDNAWESEIGDIRYARDLLSSNEDALHKIVLTHIPLYDDSRFTDEFLEEYAELCETYNVDFSMHGHNHKQQFIENFTDKTSMLICDAILNRVFYLVHVKESGISFERIDF